MIEFVHIYITQDVKHKALKQQKTGAPTYLKCFAIPVVIGATGTVTRIFKKNLETIPGKHSIDSLQKAAVLGTSHIIKKVLQSET
jgi:hypothetical protein